MPAKRRKILVSNALPYGNGSIHIGHLLGYIQGDIWVRFQRLRGHECHFVCAVDAHGTPVMLSAREEGIAPEELVQRIAAEQARDFADCEIEFDNFHTTHSDENRQLLGEVFAALKEAGHVEQRTIKQAYDPEEKLFLPDRYVRGTCPNCGTPDQYGDNCEKCSATYTPLDLVDPRSVLSDSKPEARESLHYFFKLTHFEQFLQEWMASAQVGDAVRNKLQEWFESGLQDWDITRDAPYFGFNIPGHDDKFFYVWVDAPLGYAASFLNFVNATGDASFDDYWRNGDDTELHHFIGKDIMYFHCLFWPAMLKGAGWRVPTGVHAHGFLTYDKVKMSKSRGTFIRARTYLDHIKPDYLRYYFFAKLNPGIDNIDFSPDDFVSRVNADLVGKLVNIASRCAGFIHKGSSGQLADELHDQALFDEFVSAGDSIAEHY
ncbi:MAG: methionine--tRNA ligase, partial [Xanthomonadales bacterium]|nr:methionine--tRNA ligase [Xanthomonadales bacterium]